MVMKNNESIGTSTEIYDMPLVVYIISKRIDGVVEVKFQEVNGEPYFIFDSVDRVQELTREFYCSGLSESFEKFYQSVREVDMAVEIAGTAHPNSPNRRF